MFLFHFGGLVALLGYTFYQYSGITGHSVAFSGPSIQWHYTLVNLGSVLVVALVASFILLRLMGAIPSVMIHLAYLACIVMFGVLATGSILAKSTGPAIVFTLMALVCAGFYVFALRRIPFSAALMRTVVQIMDIYPSLLLVSGLAVGLCVLYGGLISLWAESMHVLVQDASEQYALLIVLGGVYVVFSWYWTSEVIMNVLQTCIAGVFATFYFVHGTGQTVRNPTRNSLIRATTYSLGSICFGSLLVAIIRTWRFLLQLLRDDNSVAGLVVDCLLSILESLVTYFNYYAYTQIAIYGKPYIQAARDSWELFKARGVDAVTNDNLVGTCIFMYSLVVAILSAGVSILVFSNHPREELVIRAVFSAFLGLLVAQTVFQVMGAGCTTTFVCLAEDPEALRRTKPKLYELLMQKYGAQLHPRSHTLL